MKNKKIKITFFINFLLLVLAFNVRSINNSNDSLIISKPPMGWNSFDSYGVYLHHDAAIRNIDEMAKRYKQSGYKYFVIDAGWFGEYKLVEGTLYPREAHASTVDINEYGLLQPSTCYFPHGLKVLADRCHKNGLKFGIHLMRGIPRRAVEMNTKIEGTNYTARDIADTTSTCAWNQQNYGVDMRKPGAQEFYNSLVNQLATWGVDFIKEDDIVPYPREIEGVVNAISQCGRPMILSLSPGDNVDPNLIESFKRANMLRITGDIWDDQIGINDCFNAWIRWQGTETNSFYIDMDMIPFGELQIMSPKPKELSGNESKEEIKNLQKQGYLNNVELLAGKGWHRRSKLNKNQHYTFITLRALSSSPLFIGGDLVSMDDFSYRLLTNKEMLACNQNSVMGKIKYERNFLETWNAPKRNTDAGWIGIFNRDLKKEKKIILSNDVLGIKNALNYNLFDIWGDKTCKLDEKIKIEAGGVLFLKYERK